MLRSAETAVIVKEFNPYAHVSVVDCQYTVTPLYPDCVVFTRVFKTIADPADCEVRSVIDCFNARTVKTVEIPLQLVEVHGENVMSDRKMIKWISEFNKVRTNYGLGDLLFKMMV
ncbi:hypothetical protein TNCV_3402541 [Trichonephila clavipes]|nr:hypothetical protein TNCV_3402541 [Trichonephila clavipes]